MSIAPIVKTVRVKAAPARAFDLFTQHMADWWPKGQTVGKNPHVAVVMEPKAGGQWFERDAEGNETHWGKVLAWEPPSRVLLAWQLNSQWTYDANFQTEVELSFAAVDGGGTIVTLEHRQLERFGADAERHAASLRGGWPTKMQQFADWADAQAAESKKANA
jgi:uncharacterized protein YndB with AHSA1/START domain